MKSISSLRTGLAGMQNALQGANLQADLLYGLEARPPLGKALVAACAHLLAIVASIAAAPLLIARGLGLDAASTVYVIGGALVVSGIATFVQVGRLGPLGSGLLSVQGTSFSFIGPLVAAGGYLSARGLDVANALGVLLGSCAVGAALTMAASLCLKRLRRIITVQVAGVTIVLLGLTLVGSAWNNLRLAATAAAAAGEPVLLVWVEAAVVIAAIVLLSTRRDPWLRLSSICVGLLVGMCVALLSGSLQAAGQAPPGGLLLPRLLPYTLGFDFGVFLLLAPIFLVTMTESIGDLTATSALSGCPVSGDGYWRRVRGGVLADGFNTVLAALFGTFPNTTFSQNNGVIQLTGVASRFVGLLVAALLVLLGLVPGFVYLFQLLPGSVLHAATGLMFGMIVLSGLRILCAQADGGRGLRMLLVCGLAAWLLSLLPKLTVLPDYAALLLGFPVASGAMLAMLWQALDPS